MSTRNKKSKCKCSSLYETIKGNNLPTLDWSLAEKGNGLFATRDKCPPERSLHLSKGWSSIALKEFSSWEVSLP